MVAVLQLASRFIVTPPHVSLKSPRYWCSRCPLQYESGKLDEPVDVVCSSSQSAYQIWSGATKVVDPAACALDMSVISEPTLPYTPALKPCLRISVVQALTIFRTAAVQEALPVA